ncbi:MAG: transglycosylase domain-containing protein, partial [Acutalibacteraceae bacterium]
DSRVQSAIDEVYADSSNFLRIKSVSEDPQSGLVVMDYNGHILGMMGGYGEKNANMLYNRAVDAKRPTGSTIKPISAYSPALEFDVVTYSSIINDSPLTLSDGTKWPKNADGTYRGATYLWDGLRRSVNTIAAHLVDTLSPQKSFDYLVNKYHISTLVTARADSDGKVLTDIALGPMAIGSLTEGATVLEMTTAYACFGNLGYYYEPTTYTKVTDKNGVLLLEYDSSAESAISEDTATIMNKMMQNVVQSGTGAKGAFDGWQLYGKTGTTSDTKDLWFIGGSAYYICGVWYGYDTPTKMAGMSMNPALKVWKAVMQKAHSGLEKKYFPVSSDVTYRYYCTETGLLATDACTSCQLGWYKNSNLPTCTAHQGTILGEQQISAQPFKKPAEDNAQPSEDAGEQSADAPVSDEIVTTNN